MDDAFGQHGLDFENLELVTVKEKGTGTDLRHRYAIVMRRCENVEEFFIMDTATIRLVERILKALESS
jgi:hypothetical protein